MTNNSPEQSRDYRCLIIIGGFALLAAMSVDVIAVIGRATRLPLLGSIELVQYVVGVSGALAMIVATLHKRHATVRILLSRLKGTSAHVIRFFDSICCALFFLALFAGSVWVLADLWYGFEESEYWRLPYRPLRLFMALAALAVVGIFLRQAWQDRQS
jgi:TRAP-type C4-dicarboxylate transport system permease small subunit